MDGSASAYSRRGGLLVRIGRAEEGLSDLERAHELGRRSETLTFNRAVALQELGRCEEALALIEGMTSAAAQELRARCDEQSED